MLNDPCRFPNTLFHDCVVPDVNSAAKMTVSSLRHPPPSRVLRRIATIVRLLVLVALILLLTTCQYRPSMLQQVRNLGVLRVASINSAATYYLGADGPRGFEYDLAKGFADALHVKLKVIVVPDRRSIVEAVAQGRAQIGIGLAISAQRRRQVRFTPVYSQTKLKAVYRHAGDAPTGMADLSGRLVLARDSALTEWLHQQHPSVDFSVDADANTEELMARIASGDVFATIANADLVAMNQRYYPNLRVGFTLSGVRQRLAWAFAKAPTDGWDDGLYNKAIAYLTRTRHSGQVHILHDRYFGHAARLGFVGGAEFARQVKARLAKWKPYFKKTGARYGVDWRLIAAVAYQESRWDQHAQSPTQVKGMMMLTKATAARMHVKNRQNPQQSIDGGTRYLLDVRSRLPDDIKPPDRTWFALAAYNIGLGHILDARHLLRLAGRDPSVWVDLRDGLGWLSQKRYLHETRFGYAQGKEAAAYVGDVRAYYDILRWMTAKKDQSKPAALDEQPSAAGADDGNPAKPPDISIDSPAF